LLTAEAPPDGNHRRGGDRAGQDRAKRLPKGSWRLLREAILIGEFPRARATELTGYQERQARTVLGELVARGLLVSDTPKGSVRLGFPSGVIECWFPGLYQSRTAAAAEANKTASGA
jgi:hypothetical protein